MSTDETKPQDFEKKKVVDHGHIKGWGIDANPKNDPTYPIKNRDNSEQKGYSWKRPPQQPVNEEILKSVERPNITATFGTSAPPKGLSGMIRRKAFKYSESSYGRWLPLILADRINVMEGIIDDIRHGHFPNIIAERGWMAEWKYNRKAAITKIVTIAAITGAVVALMILQKNQKKRRMI